MLVTHEQDEAFDLGDRVAVLRSGRLEQVGTPDELYGAPANLFVAGFVGRSSTLEVNVIEVGPRGARVEVESVEWLVDTTPGRPLPASGPAVMLVRPESIRLSAPGPGAVPATVTARRFVGPNALFTLNTERGKVFEAVAPSAAARIGEIVGVLPSRRAGAGIHLFQGGES